MGKALDPWHRRGHGPTAPRSPCAAVASSPWASWVSWASACCASRLGQVGWPVGDLMGWVFRYRNNLVAHPTARKWVITPVISDLHGISRVNPLITGVITHLLSGMSHQVIWLLVWNIFIPQQRKLMFFPQQQNALGSSAMVN